MKIEQFKKEPWFMKVSEPPGELIQKFEEIPGCYKQRGSNTWKVPHEVLELVGVKAPSIGNNCLVPVPSNAKPWQIEPIIRGVRERRLILGDDTGLGKAEKNSAKLCTPKGWVRMGDIRPGDRVMAADGLPTRVLAVYPQGVVDIYKVTFSDGAEANVTKDHLWSVTTRSLRARGQHRVVKTSELQSCYKEAVAIPFCDSILYPKKDLKVSPYLVGVALGDGCLSTKACRVSTTVPALVENLRAETGWSWTHLKNGTASAPEFPQAMRSIGLALTRSETKFIPQEYLFGSEKQRLKLLQGLMDTDGFIAKGGVTSSYSTVSEQLSVDFLELVRSLGGWAKRTSRYTQYTYKGEKKQGQLCYRINFNLPRTDYVRVPVKLGRLRQKKGWRKLRTVVSVELSHREAATCISIEHPAKLYVTEDYVVTHNTFTAISITRMLKSKRVLIVCPAIVRLNWSRQLDLWWPDHHEVGIIEKGRKLKNVSKPERLRIDQAYAAPIQIVSYALLKHLDGLQYDSIIFDEVNACQNPAAQCSKAAMALVKSNSYSSILGLTATVIPDQPKNVHGQLHLIWPNRFGKLIKSQKYSYSFNSRYTNMVPNEHGPQFEGLNAKHAKELKLRLDAVQCRTTKSEVRANPEWAQHLPTFDCDVLWLKSKKKRALLDLENLTPELLKETLLSAVSDKVNFTMEWVKEAQSLASHIVIATHLRATAHEIAGKLGVTAITGDMPASDRDVAIERLKAAPNAVMVCTMHAVGIGIDLTNFTQVLMAELYWRPATVIQFMGRFLRLNSTADCIFRMAVMEGTMDERMAMKIEQKVKDMGDVTKAGLSEMSLEDSFEVSEADILESLKDVF